LHKEVLEDGGFVAILTPDLLLFPVLDSCVGWRCAC